MRPPDDCRRRIAQSLFDRHRQQESVLDAGRSSPDMRDRDVLRAQADLKCRQPNANIGPMQPCVDIAKFVVSFRHARFSAWHGLSPWALTTQSSTVVRALLAGLCANEYSIAEEVAVHRSAIVESGSVLKGPVVVGPDSFVAANAYLRGGVWLDERCIIGPGAELKSTFAFAGTKLAHFNFVGDSILGADVNLEAGSIICNYRNERPAKEVLVRLDSTVCGTGVEKFGALIGDGSRIGANAVLAPGALLERGSVVGRARLIDQEALP